MPAGDGGHVRERGRGNWYAVLSTQDPQTGKRKVKFISLSARGKREAQLAVIVAQRAACSFTEPSKATVTEFLARWLAYIETQVQPRTVASMPSRSPT